MVDMKLENKVALSIFQTHMKLILYLYVSRFVLFISSCKFS